MLEKTDILNARERSILLAAGTVGLLAFGVGLLQTPQRAWASLLLANFYFLSLALYGTVFVALNYVFGARWAVLFRRVPEAMSAYLPVGAVALLALYLGREELYVWARPEAVAASPHLQHKAAYLNPGFFFLRLAIASGIWIAFSHLLRRYSRQEDLDGDPSHTRRGQAFSAVFLALFAVTFTYSSFDLVMSLEPDWYSTIFPLYTVTGLFLGGTAAMTALVIWFQGRGLLSGVTADHRYELLRLLIAAATAWAFIAFSQYLLIYYTNIPEEAAYYARRMGGPGRSLFLLNLALNWGIPVAILLPTGARRSWRRLLGACALVLAGRWLDLWLLIVPAVIPGARVTPLELLIPLAFLSLFLFPAVADFRRAEPVPGQAPRLVESGSLRV